MKNMPLSIFSLTKIGNYLLIKIGMVLMPSGIVNSMIHKPDESSSVEKEIEYKPDIMN